jgi:16S rRNA (guanine527-N7)-methyltransferase
VTEPAERLRARAPRVLGRPLRDDEATLLHNYLNLLIKWQKTHRLVGSSDPDWIVDNVILDSLLFARALPRPVTSICDVGSGAGIPGIPLKIVLSTVDVTLIEPRQRRASFLSTVIRELSLQRCRVINARLEQVVADLASTFEAVVMRCAGDIEDFVVPASRLLRAGGVIVTSGPPVPRPLAIGRWVELEGVSGPRRFWVYELAGG